MKSRMMGSTVKVSIHSEGVAQYSMESLWYGKNRPGQPNRDRHIERWEWSEPRAETASMVFRVFIPQRELRVAYTDENLSGVTWLKAPGEGKQAQNGPVVNCDRAVKALPQRYAVRVLKRDLN